MSYSRNEFVVGSLLNDDGGGAGVRIGRQIAAVPGYAAPLVTACWVVRFKKR